MTKEEFKTIAKSLELAYRRDQFFTEKAMLDEWLRLLSDLDATILAKAVDNYIQSSKYQPTIADIRGEYQKIIDHKREIYRELHEIYDRTRGIYPNSTDDAETKQAWWDLVKQKPEEERIAYARRIENITNQYVLMVERSDRETIPTITEFFRGAR